MDAYAGIDIAFAKKKLLPISVCVWRDGVLEPLPLRSTTTPVPPQGSGNAKILDNSIVKDFVESTARYLRDVERAFGVTIRRIAIDAPSDPKTNGAARREAEKGLDRKKISCITTPDSTQFGEIRAKAEAHLAEGGEESRLPHANQLWMLVGFELFRRLRQEWECLEVFPQAIAATLGANGVHKTKGVGLLKQLSAAARFTGWPKAPDPTYLHQIGYGRPHDNLDAYMAAWVAGLEVEDREPIGVPPDDVIWVPRPAPQAQTVTEPPGRTDVRLTDALEDVRIAFLQVEYAIRLLTYCEGGKIDTKEFDTDHTILLEKGNLGFPSGHFSDPDNVVRAANVSVALALGASALALDKAFQEADLKPDPLSDDNLVRLRTLVYMVRCAYAHGIAAPKWEVFDKYKTTLTVGVTSGRIEIDLPSLHGKEFDFGHIGGHHIWFEIKDETLAALSCNAPHLIPETGAHFAKGGNGAH